MFLGGILTGKMIEHIMMADVIIPLVAIALAEFGDKTQLSLFFLSSKTKKSLHLLLGTVFAFPIVDGAAVFLDYW